MAALVRVQIVYNTCLYIFPKFKYRQLANIVTGNETGVHHSNQEEKLKTKYGKYLQKYGKNKHGRVPVDFKRTISTKTVLYCEFFSCKFFSYDGITIWILVPNGSVTDRYIGISKMIY